MSPLRHQLFCYSKTTASGAHRGERREFDYVLVVCLFVFLSLPTLNILLLLCKFCLRCVDTFDVLATTKKRKKQTVAQTTTAQKKNAQRERDVVHLWSKPKLSIALYRVVRHDCDFIWNKRSTAMMQL